MLKAEDIAMSNEINLVNVYSILTPLAILMIAVESVICWVAKKKGYITYAEAITNLGTAIGNQCVNLAVAYLVMVTFGWVYEYRLFTLPTTVLNFCLLLVAFDFLFYWFHRHGHSINILWAAHMPHHSSNEFNLYVGVRASITQRIFSFTYMWPLALIGFRPEAIYAASAVQLMIALWHHTRLIKNMGWYEIIFNTPAYHRVHHAINEKYLDKNFGEIFIIWDKMFGTYAKEVEEPVFGCLTPIESCNPNKIYVQYWKMLFDDMKMTKSWWDKIRLWFMPLGWRPEDVRHLPRYRVNEHTIKPYIVKVNTHKKIYLALQAALGLAIMKFTIDLTLEMTIPQRLTLIFVLWVMITAWGYVLENKMGRAMESVKFFIIAGVFGLLNYSGLNLQTLNILFLVLLAIDALYMVTRKDIDLEQMGGLTEV
jgi:alkylglycerol monooxygenase